jgi:lipoprotein LprG
MPRRTRTLLAASLALIILAAAGCSRGGNNDEDPSDLPEAAQLLAAAADEMEGIETVRLQLESDTDLGNLQVRQADAQITATGEAQGTGQVDFGGQLMELQFVMVEDTFHYQTIGPWLRMPRDAASSIYDPSAILDAETGVPHLLRNAQEPAVTGTGTVSGVAVYEVTATFTAADMAAVLPGVAEDVPGTLWIGVDRPLLHQAEFDVSGGTVTVTLSEFDEPVQSDAP